ncbi:MAG: NAD(P)-dependent oxidoreductase [Acidimicrobiales bacterium]
MNKPDPERRLRVAVIGTGTMGTAMGSRLLAANMEVHGWSRHLESTQTLVGLGATGTAEVADAVADADVVLTMLPTADVTIEVMFDAAGIDAMRPGAIWLQMATIGVNGTERVHSLARARRPDVTFVDAPVSGSRGPAESGHLLILASGPKSAAALLEPVLGVLGRRTIWLGSVGGGSRMKLILNTWLAFQTESAAESASLARRLGVDPYSLVDALSDNPLASEYALTKLDRILKGDFRPDFSLDLALKDLELVEADAGADAAPIAGRIADRWRDLVQSGSSGLDVSAAGRGLGEAARESDGTVS